MMFEIKGIKVNNLKKERVWIILTAIVLVIAGLVFSVNNFDLTSAQTATVCCAETISGAFCQNVPEGECLDGSQQVPTSCESTSFCRGGTCFDSSEGTCLDNTPQLVCNDNGGVWSLESPPQCELGCCVLGDQAAFVTLTRCKALSAQLGLKTNYDSGISNEFICVATTQLQDRGACVYTSEFETTCQFTTRAECDSGVADEETGETSVVGEFFADKLCSAEELATNCGPSTRTTCVDGRDEVYFVDTCGNPANIYDSSKVSDKEYWTNVRSKSESCGAGSANSNSAGCGNCDYFEGSYCRDQSSASGNPTYGDFICADLNCRSTSNGQSYKHGESWCDFDSQSSVGANPVGSRFFKHICINGEEVVEACADFRNEECIEDDINGFSQAACRVNRWQDCVHQSNQEDCENTDRRDCLWKPEVFFGNGTNGGACLPANPPGLNFWDSGDTQAICSQGNAVCIVEFEQGIFSDEECVKNCDCLEESWEQERGEVCKSLGDCGPNINYLGREGNKEGFKIVIENLG
jgi:hypothetical protein